MNNSFQSGPLTFSGTTFGGAAGNNNVKRNKQAKKNRKKKSNTSSTNPFGNNNPGGGFKNLNGEANIPNTASNFFGDTPSVFGGANKNVQGSSTNPFLGSKASVFSGGNNNLTDTGANFNGKSNSFGVSFGKINGDASNFGMKVCRYDPNCTRPNCKFYHPSRDGNPKSSKRTQSMETTVCKYDNHCKRANCKYLHPSRGEGKFASIKASKTQFNSNRNSGNMAETSHFFNKIQTKKWLWKKKER